MSIVVLDDEDTAHLNSSTPTNARDEDEDLVPSSQSLFRQSHRVTVLAI